MIITNKKERERFLKFAVVGVIGAVLDFGIFNLLNEIVGFPALYASMVSFVAAIISNFLWNRFWTYPDSRHKTVTAQVIQFLIVSLIGLSIRALLFTPFESFILNLSYQIILSSFFLEPSFIGHNFTLAILILIVMFWNFFANRFWTYNDVKSI
jgi:putative flippase GtrA